MHVEGAGQIEGTREYQHPNVRQLIKRYLESREAFYVRGGGGYIKERSELRTHFLQADINPDQLDAEVDSIQNNRVKEVMSHRVGEWKFKIENGMLKRGDPLTLTHQDFVAHFRSFVERHEGFMESDEYAKLEENRGALRNAVSKEFIIRTPQDVIQKYQIEDPELQNRIVNEWFPKYIARRHGQ